MLKINVIHPFLFSIFPVLLIYSQNINLLPPEELFFPIIIITGFSLLSWQIIKYVSGNTFKAGLIVSLFLVIFFSYGHIYNLLTDFTIFDYEIGRHRFLLIPVFISLVAGIFFLIKTSRTLNNLSSIANVISITAVVIIIGNIGLDISQENYFDSEKMSVNERFLGVGAHRDSFFEIFDQESKQDSLSSFSIEISDKPDIYYIILDEYGSKNALKKFFNYDNTRFLSILEQKGFFIFDPSFTNYPTTVQSLGSSLNMDYINDLTHQVGKESKNYHLLNKVLSENIVMKKLKENNFQIINMGALWGPNNSFKMSDADLCEFKEFNRDSLMRELLQTTMLSYVQERLVEEGRRDRVLCVFDELPKLDENFSGSKFVFAHIMLPHAPYIFGPNGESVIPGTSLDGQSWDTRKAHIDQLNFANKKIIILIDELLSKNKNSIIIIQGDTGSSFSSDWKNPSDDVIIERMSNLNAIYFPNNEYQSFSGKNTPVNTFRIIFNEFFSENYKPLEDKMYWSTSDSPYSHSDVTSIIEKNYRN